MSAGTGTVAMSLGLCLCAGQLVAPPAASAAAAAPVTTTVAAARPVKPAVAASYDKRTISRGAKVRVTTTLIDPKTGKKLVGGYVLLQGKYGNKWKTWQRKRNTSGVVAFRTGPHVTRWFRTTYGTAATTPVQITVRTDGARILAEARKHKGAPYVFGAAGPKRFDCSGYTQYVYKKAVGKKLPHKANLQQRYGKAVSKSNKKAGDLLVFRSGSYGTHVAIYAGGGYMWASPRAGKTVSKQKVYSSNYVVRRMI
ncbi:cell wall-associated NlpC family hydrolase [Couchioplanes caeruleus]|uniref:Cell wall-associated NlpC family hydrolase n=3 Tax=Couchioplanes caeruleus TaxID=56438 RepID=A0A3N1GL08_9ACTN|nr:cell wall-associated NlpC family hydrolase [Couchioplanes caeruleus]